MRSLLLLFARRPALGLALALSLALAGLSLLAAPTGSTVPAPAPPTAQIKPPDLDAIPEMPPWVAARLAYLDARSLPPEEAVYFRYLWLDEPREKWPDELLLHKVHANLRSTQGQFGQPVLVAPGLVRIDLREYGWDQPGKLELWEKFARLDFMFHAEAILLADGEIEQVWPGGKDNGVEYEKGIYEHVPKKKGDTFAIPAPWLPCQGELHKLRHILLTEAPILPATWQFVQTARQLSLRNEDEGVGYYHWLGIKNRDDFFALCGADREKAFRIYREWRAVIRRSGISQQSRQAFRIGATAHAMWGTLDTFKQFRRGQPLVNLRRGEFVHQAEEWYSYLPCGLMLTALFNADGLAQATAPDQVGPDDSEFRVGKDARVHVNISCIRCHGMRKDMLQPLDSALRKCFRQGGALRLVDYDRHVTLELASQYLRELNSWLDIDRSLYVQAIRACTSTSARPQGLGSVEFTRLYCGAWNRYVEAKVTPLQAARELGVSGRHLLACIRGHAHKRGNEHLILAQLLDRDPWLTRLEWEECYPLAACLVHGLHLPEKPDKVKVKIQKKVKP